MLKLRGRSLDALLGCLSLISELGSNLFFTSKAVQIMTQVGIEPEAMAPRHVSYIWSDDEYKHIVFFYVFFYVWGGGEDGSTRGRQVAQALALSGHPCFDNIIHASRQPSSTLQPKHSRCFYTPFPLHTK